MSALFAVVIAGFFGCFLRVTGVDGFISTSCHAKSLKFRSQGLPVLSFVRRLAQSSYTTKSYHEFGKGDFNNDPKYPANSYNDLSTQDSSSELIQETLEDEEIKLLQDLKERVELILCRLNRTERLRPEIGDLQHTNSQSHLQTGSNLGVPSRRNGIQPRVGAKASAAYRKKLKRPGLKGAIKATAPLGVIDPESKIEGTIATIDGEPCDIMLAVVNPVNHIDKFFILQLIREDSHQADKEEEKEDDEESLSAWVVFARWGRTGTWGQARLQKFDDFDDAEIFLQRN